MSYESTVADKCLISILFDTFSKSNTNFMKSNQPSTSHCTNNYDHDFDVNLNGSLTIVLYPIMLSKPANHISFATRSISTQLLSWFDNDELAVLPENYWPPLPYYMQYNLDKCLQKLSFNCSVWKCMLLISMPRVTFSSKLCLIISVVLWKQWNI